ncbi:MAG: iron-sulfur cluster assembly accessory protein [Acidobacteriota bacterium]|nr:iron-sulfur cluster assembly accessory protein [Acidobacteriota bacterium]
MSMVSLQTETNRSMQAESASPTRDPLAGRTLLEPAEGSADQKAIRITEHALKRIRTAMAKEGVSPDQGGLRLGVLGGGCSGLSYSIRFDSKPRERDRVYLFGAGVPTVGDVTEASAVRIFVDPKSFLYLHGMVLDFEETLMRQGFNFINPNSTKSCGCGSSFTA